MEKPIDVGLFKAHVDQLIEAGDTEQLKGFVYHIIDLTTELTRQLQVSSAALQSSLDQLKQSKKWADEWEAIGQQLLARPRKQADSPSSS